jgi:hypothetical protein
MVWSLAIRVLIGAQLQLVAQIAMIKVVNVSVAQELLFDKSLLFQSQLDIDVVANRVERGRVDELLLVWRLLLLLLLFVLMYQLLVFMVLQVGLDAARIRAVHVVFLIVKLFAF